mgnify:CR=1 FL=1
MADKEQITNGATTPPLATGRFGLSESAATRITAMLAGEVGDSFFRVAVNGGGCSGFQYGFDIATDLADDDTVVELGEAAIVIDPLSYQYLVGSTIDYEEGLAGARFMIQNPNATSTCGCGSSFMV